MKKFRQCHNAEQLLNDGMFRPSYDKNSYGNSFVRTSHFIRFVCFFLKSSAYSFFGFKSKSAWLAFMVEQGLNEYESFNEETLNAYIASRN